MWPRTVSVVRSVANDGTGLQGESGARVGQETSVVSNLPASIQAQREGQRDPVGLPTDGTRPVWRIYLKPGAVALGVIRDRDIAVDDLGNRYQVVADYWDSLGYRLHCERLEA